MTFSFKKHLDEKLIKRGGGLGTKAGVHLKAVEIVLRAVSLWSGFFLRQFSVKKSLVDLQISTVSHLIFVGISYTLDRSDTLSAFEYKKSPF